MEDLGEFLAGLTTCEADSGWLSEELRASQRRYGKAKWHLGIRSTSPPDEIMREIFRVMKKV